MNDTEKILIDQLIKDKPYLSSSTLYERSYKYVKEVLELEEWNDPKF